ncbi:MAG: hypothetical protein HYZ29_17110 [Myxococcales bacterium]|nr:hypothetical protein [Myxococcales bacterium]
MRLGLALVIVAGALLACKSGNKGRESTATASTPPPPPPPKVRFRPSLSQLEGVCAGNGVASIEPGPRDRASAALFVKRDPAGKLEHLAYQDIVANKDGLAVSFEDAALVACIEVTKKKKNKRCVMEPLDPTKIGGTLVLHSWEYTVTLREAKTGKMISEKKVKRDDTKCPPLHSFKQIEEDLLPPFEVSASLAVSSYREGK